ncbi:hypothetical protein GOODEAATRI_029310 [Goodea atripinnis]|uniref:Secreted protein n=1 Tax=Goodea atripinnis TaxID=208336 RepID=A0ABV0N5E6_9TELE
MTRWRTLCSFFCQAVQNLCAYKKAALIKSGNVKRHYKMKDSSFFLNLRCFLSTRGLYFSFPTVGRQERGAEREGKIFGKGLWVQDTNSGRLHCGL